MPAQTLPEEIWGEIFEWVCVDTGVPSRKLALVSKHWKQLILGLPRLWSKVEVDMTTLHPPEVILDRLERRLRHARDVNLDVVIINTSKSFWIDNSHYLNLFKTLVKLGPVERWHSLQICDYHSDDPLILNEVLTGKFSSLRVLIIVYDTWQTRPGMHSDLVRLAVHSRPSLKHLGLYTDQLPINLEPLFQQQAITTFSGRVKTFHMLPQDFLANLREVRLDCAHSGWFKPNAPKALPQCRATITNFSPWAVTTIDARNVTMLHISVALNSGVFLAPFELPNLHTLHLSPCVPQLLEVFNAPKVQVLKLSRAHEGGKSRSLKMVRNDHKALAHLLFQKNRQLLTIYPISVTIDVMGITNTTLLVMLEAWPQLKHLSIVLDDSFECFGIFAKRWRDQKSPLFPNLETMYMEVDWHTNGRKWNRWKVLAKEMMLASKDLPLRSIIWRNSWFGVESITQNNM
ncbi:hypothetical protein FS842_002241 [Serendipita sp. 407]|nr:hypothetical protein FS842_002241 [Serendipita sp. 407]